MILTEEEAKLKVCPYRQRGHSDYEPLCLGTGCMRWEWVDQEMISGTYASQYGLRPPVLPLERDFEFPEAFQRATDEAWVKAGWTVTAYAFNSVARYTRSNPNRRGECGHTLQVEPS